MIKRLRISVQVPHPNKTGQFKELYRNMIETDCEVSFEFNKLIDAFYVLYPYDSLIINFTLC